AVVGYQALRDSLLSGQGDPLKQFLASAGHLVAHRTAHWAQIVADGPLAQAEDSVRRVTALAAGEVSQLHQASVHRMTEPPMIYGMCGLLHGYRADRAEDIGGLAPGA